MEPIITHILSMKSTSNESDKNRIFELRVKDVSRPYNIDNLYEYASKEINEGNCSIYQAVVISYVMYSFGNPIIDMANNFDLSEVISKHEIYDPESQK